MKCHSVMVSIGLIALASVRKPSRTRLIAAAGLFGAAGMFASGTAAFAGGAIVLHQLQDGTSLALGGSLAPAISDGQIVFNGANGTLYTENADGTGLTQIINQQTSIPGGMPSGTPSTFDIAYGNQARIGAGQVVFLGTNSASFGDTSAYGLYSVPIGGGTVTLLANEATMVNGSLIGGSADPSAFPFDFQVSSTGPVVFQVDQQIYTVPANGGAVTCVATNLCSDGQVLNQSLFQSPAISGNTVALVAGQFGGTEIVTTPLPSTPESFTPVATNAQYDGFSLGALPAQDGNTTVFYAENSSDTVTGIFTSSGTTLVSNSGTLTLGGNGHGPQVAASNGLVVFEATNASNQVGLYEMLETGGAITPIVVSGQVLPQGTVQNVDMGLQPLSNGQLVFTVEMNFGGQIWEADLLPNPRRLSDSHDFNGDGASDILWKDTSGDMAMWLISGAQESSGASLGNVGTSWSVVGTRDFNNDGDADILWLDTAGDLATWLMNGTSVASFVSLGNVGTQWSVVGTGDFNGDGTGDILWQNTSTGAMAIWLMSNGAFSSGVSLGTVPSPWEVAGTGDFNGDGTTDILWRNTSTGDLAIWFMSNGQMSSGVDLGQVATTWSVVGTGDFNGDGTSDILWRDSSGNVALWLMSNGQFSSGATLGQVPTVWSVAETGDFNADGNSDILWIDQSGDLGVWEMDGLSVSAYVGLGSVGGNWTVQGRNAD